jgi:hypothetical protein
MPCTEGASYQHHGRNQGQLVFFLALFYLFFIFIFRKKIGKVWTYKHVFKHLEILKTLLNEFKPNILKHTNNLYKG